jgi:hypothetical protein
MTAPTLSLVWLSTTETATRPDARHDTLRESESPVGRAARSTSAPSSASCRSLQGCAKIFMLRPPIASRPRTQAEGEAPCWSPREREKYAYLSSASQPVLVPRLDLAAHCYHPAVLDCCVERVAAQTERRGRVGASSRGLRRTGRGVVAGPVRWEGHIGSLGCGLVVVGKAVGGP